MTARRERQWAEVVVVLGMWIPPRDWLALTLGERTELLEAGRRYPRQH